MADPNKADCINVQNLVESLPQLSSLIFEHLSVRIPPLTILTVLTEETEKDIVTIARKEMTPLQIINIIKNSSYITSLPIFIESIILDNSLIPDRVFQNLEEERIKSKGEIWVIHKNDRDPFPSSPHAHNYESGLKLHLGNGDLYRSRNVVTRLSKKSLMQLRKKVTKSSLPPLEV